MKIIIGGYDGREEIDNLTYVRVTDRNLKVRMSI